MSYDTFTIIEGYSMEDADPRDFRERLAYGAAPEWIAHPQPVRRVEGIKVKDPVTGEWSEL